MKQLHDDEITGLDLTGWLDSTSDFEFELSILKMLTDRRLHALHGGSYFDPITKKKRQFDLRCQIRPSLEWRRGNFESRLAIECKNIGANFPLLVQCMPRASSESWHELIATSDTAVHQIQCWRHCSPYHAGNPTGKSLSQVGRDTQKKTFVATDSDVYEKWAQALSSAHGLAYSTPADTGASPKFTLVLAIVVVPDHRLWAVQYDGDGNRTEGPIEVNRIPYFVSDEMKWKHDKSELTFNISHLEIVTKTGLLNLVEALQSENGIDIWFSQTMTDQYIADHAKGDFSRHSSD